MLPAGKLENQLEIREIFQLKLIRSTLKKQPLFLLPHTCHFSIFFTVSCFVLFSQNTETKGSMGCCSVCLWLSRNSHLHLQSAWTRGRSRNASSTRMEPFLNIKLLKNITFSYIEDLPILIYTGSIRSEAYMITLDHVGSPSKLDCFAGLPASSEGSSATRKHPGTACKMRCRSSSSV